MEDVRRFGVPVRVRSNRIPKGSCQAGVLAASFQEASARSAVLLLERALRTLSTASSTLSLADGFRDSDLSHPVYRRQRKVT